MASTEVLGKGSVGTSYKAVLEEGTTVVVKRLKDVSVSKMEFEVVMEGIGRVKHANVVPLRAYYFSEDEKLLVYDFMPAGSISALLHVYVQSASSHLEIATRSWSAGTRDVLYEAYPRFIARYGHIIPMGVVLRWTSESRLHACLDRIFYFSFVHCASDNRDGCWFVKSIGSDAPNENTFELGFIMRQTSNSSLIFRQ